MSLFGDLSKDIAIKKEYTFDNTDRNKFVCKMYDIVDSTIITEIKTNFDLDFDWNIGLIVGQSGTGKSTIAKEKLKDFYLFEEHEWDNTKSILDNFNEDIDNNLIVEALTKVGFSSPTNWLKPYNLLSNGQRMRVDLARVLLEESDTVIFDEFTSVVDRDVAKITSLAVNKFIRKNNLKFVAVSCHHDIEEWLEPDWVYNTDTKEFSKDLLWLREDLRFNLRTAKIDEWEIFKDFHYLTHEIARGADFYVLEYKYRAIAFCAVTHFPHAKVANFKKIHRIVVLPDFQGIGIGKIFLDLVAEDYYNKEFRVSITTGSIAFINSLGRTDNWRLTRKLGKVGESQGIMKGKTSMNRETASFEYKNMKTKSLEDTKTTKSLF